MNQEGFKEEVIAPRRASGRAKGNAGKCGRVEIRGPALCLEHPLTTQQEWQTGCNSLEACSARLRETLKLSGHSWRKNARGMDKGKGKLIPRFGPQPWERGRLGGAGLGWVAAERTGAELGQVKAEVPGGKSEPPTGSSGAGNQIREPEVQVPAGDTHLGVIGLWVVINP